MATTFENLERFAFGSPILTDREVRVAARPATALIGRILMGPIFILSGFTKLASSEAALGYMQAEGIPYARPLLVLAALVELLGGLSILTGSMTRVGATALVLFLIPTTLIFHDFWTYTGVEQSAQTANFMKNLAIMGGLSLLIAYGPGRYALDNRLRRQRVTE